MQLYLVCKNEFAIQLSKPLLDHCDLKSYLRSVEILLLDSGLEYVISTILIFLLKNIEDI